MFRSRIARIVVMAILLGSLSSAPASAIYMQRPDWFDGGDPGDPRSVGIYPSVSSTVFPITANLAGPNLIPGVSGTAPKVVILSTGVDKSVFPATVTSRIEVRGDKDVIGYGTYAASAVLQTAPDASIYSYNIYPNKEPSASYLNIYLKEVKDTLLFDPSRFDAVLIAIPPSDVLDPISGAMEGGIWDFLLQSAAQSQFQTDEGTMVGIPSDEQLLSSRNLPHGIWATTEAFRRVSVTWESIRTTLKSLKTKVATVIPAGDFGSGVQRILGLANLPELITVGGYNPKG